MKYLKKNTIFNNFFCLVLSFLLFLILTSKNVLSQKANYNFNHLDVNSGLSSGVVNSIYKDTKGFLWASTYDGLNKFDGINCTVYSENGINVEGITGTLFLNILEDKNSNIWVGSNKGLNFYCRDSNRYTCFTIPNRGNDNQFFSPFYLDNDDVIWGRSGFDLFTFDIMKRKFKHIKKFPLTQSLYIQTLPQELYKKLETIYIVSNKEPQIVVGNRKNDSINWVNIFNTNSLTFNKIYCLLPLGKNIFIGTDKGLCLLENNTLTEYSKFNGLGVKDIQTIACNNKGLIIVGTLKDGLFFFDPKDKVFLGQYKNSAAIPYSISGNEINFLYVDKQNFLWAAVWGKGINYFCFDKFRFNHILPNEEAAQLGVDNFVKSIILLKNKEYWCGTQKGGIIILDNDKKYKNSIHNIPSSIEHLFLDNNNKIWVSTFSGLFTINARTKKVTKINFEHKINNPRQEQFNYTTQLKNGNLLASTNAGVFIITRNKGNINIKRINGLAQTDVYLASYEDNDGVIYFSKAYKGFVSGAINNDSFVIKKEYPLEGSIKCFYETDNNLWMASTVGLIKIDKKNEVIKKIYTQKEGLSNQYIYGILPDGDDLWLSNNVGINKFNIINEKVTTYKVSDGLQSNEFNTYAFCKNNDNELFFGGVNGLNFFKASDIFYYKHQPQIELIQFQINDSVYKSSVSKFDALKLGYKENTLTFSFRVLDYINSKENKILYKLEGLDNNWVQSNNNSDIRYSNLSSGRYTLLVRGINSDNIKSTTLFKLPISISTPWWKQWWFISAVILAIGLLITLAIKARVRNIKKVFGIRLSISQDLHDEVGSTLSGIALYGHLSKNQLQSNQLENASMSLDIIQENASDMVTKLNDIVWLVNPDKDSLSLLFNRLEEFGLKMCVTKNIQFIFNNKGMIKNYDLPIVARKNIYMICKEAINNTIKYSEASLLEFTVNQKGKMLIIAIRDNGKGFDTATIKLGNGLNNMQKRAGELNADFSINAKLNEGCQISLTLKIP
jgi:ligand-binding sensor domain-containing protein